MIRDPFYRDIVAGLGGELDPELFERCSAELLRTIYPTLVPIRGGDDGGMDGAIAQEGGLPFPLVTTTAARVTDNLRRSLKSYLGRGGARRTVVFATSQALNSRRREGLERAAQTLGFTLLQVHDRAAFADLLYCHPAWCQELLGLTGAPPALSIMPLPTRPLVGETLVGRSADLQWLERTVGDLLVVGQPGCGKTFLLFCFAKGAGGLFVHTKDLTAIAAAVRAQQPAILIVDDAHVQRDLLTQLRRLRIETGAGFRIIADCWPGSRAEVSRALDLATSSVRELQLLSQDEIAEIVKRTGIGGPRGLIQEIVNQAEGKPGLAVTLCYLCLRGDVEQLAHGEALAGEITAVFEGLAGTGVSTHLASFAVGGNQGMSIQAVADYLSVPLMTIREHAAKLAAGGVLVEVDRERLEVRPPALRHALVRNVFFRGPASLPIEPLIELAANQDDVARTVIGAVARGARADPQLVRRLVERSRAADVWAMYAGLGRHESQWIAVMHHEWLLRIGDTVLRVAPDLVLPTLLSAAVGDNRALHAHPGHPLRQVGDWVVAARPGTPPAFERRRQLRDSVEKWLGEGGDPAVGVHALALSLSPAFSRTDAVPGSGRTITFTRGFVSLDDARAIRGLWPSLLDRLRTIQPGDWAPVRELVESWAYTGHVPQQLPADLTGEAEAFAVEMLRDIAEIGKDHPGVIHWIRAIGSRLGAHLTLPSDRVFEILFPDDDPANWRAAHALQADRATKLAEKWASDAPEAVVAEQARCEHEAELMGRKWPRWSGLVCQRLAERLPDATPWVEALLREEAAPDLVQPFVRKLLQDAPELGADVARRCMHDGRQRLATAITVLTCEIDPHGLLEVALQSLAGGAEWIKTLCVRSELPEQRVKLLLQHPDDDIACATAVGEWLAEPKGEVRQSLRSDWRRAILRADPDEWFLREILPTDPSLAKAWLSVVLREDAELWRRDEVIAAATKCLSVADRRELLTALPETLFPPEIVRQLMGGDLDLYRDLLRTARLRPLHLAPLIGYPNRPGWARLAEIALDTGYSTEEIADAAYGHSWSWSGSESAMWDEWRKRFDQLTSHPSERIRQVGRIGSDRAARELDRSTERERRERVRGW